MTRQTTMPVVAIDRLQRVARNQQRLLRYDVFATVALFVSLVAALAAAL